jgi:hypothetical protein
LARTCPTPATTSKTAMTTAHHLPIATAAAIPAPAPIGPHLTYAWAGPTANSSFHPDPPSCAGRFGLPRRRLAVASSALFLPGRTEASERGMGAMDFCSFCN